MQVCVAGQLVFESPNVGACRLELGRERPNIARASARGDEGELRLSGFELCVSKLAFQECKVGVEAREELRFLDLFCLRDQQLADAAGTLKSEPSFVVLHHSLEGRCALVLLGSAETPNNEA